MTGQDINTIRKRFRDNVTKVRPTVPVIYDNEDKKPPDQGPWIRLTILPGTSFQSAMGGTKSFRHPFMMVAQLFNDIGRGTEEHQSLVDLIVPFFRGKRADDIVWRTPSITSVGRDEKWFQWNVSCPGYTGDLVKGL